MATHIHRILSLVVTSAIVAVSTSASSPRTLAEIVYVGSDGELRCVAADGAHSRRVAKDYEYGNPAWSRNGAEVATEVGIHDGSHHLAVLNNRGRIVRHLPHSSEFVRPVWDRSGRIYAITYAKSPQIARWTGMQREILPVVGDVKQPQFLSFSPSGGQLAILDDFAAVALAHVMDDKVIVEQRLNLHVAYVAQTVWLDETTLLFVAGEREGEPSDLRRVDTRSGRVTHLETRGIYLRDFIALSPDRLFAVVCATPAEGELKWSLWIVAISGNVMPRRITSGMEDVAPTWRGGA